MRIVKVIKSPNGRGLRVFVIGQRLHHGVTGIAATLACLALHRRRAALACAVLILHDVRDWKIWFARESC